MKKLATIAIFLFFLSSAFPILAFEPATRTQITWPRSPMGAELNWNTQFHDFIRYIYEWGISLGGIVVFVMLVWAGIQYLTSAGDSGKMSSALKRIQSSILGLVLLLTSWLILNTINPQLVQLRPLPELAWTKAELPPIEVVDPRDLPMPYCEFAVIYPEEDFRGEHSPPITFGDIINQEKKKTRRVEGKGNLDYFGTNWASAKAFIRITEPELTQLNDGTLKGIQRYDAAGKPYVNGQFKEAIGNACTLHFFAEFRVWFLSLPCGRSLGWTPFPAAEFPREFDFERLNCAELRRTLPRHQN